MAGRKKKPAKAKPAAHGGRLVGLRRGFRKWLLRLVLAPVVLLLMLVLLYRFVNPPITHTIWAEQRRLGAVERQWVPIEYIAPEAPRAIVAAEDVNFCLHWGFDMRAIRAALDEGANRGASTLTQQTVKNVFLWQGRSWPRKALEALITPLVEIAWPKERILEIYLNVAEMDEGVFGIEAAAHRYFDTSPRELSAMQAALIAAALPDPKRRNPARPSDWLRRRAASIADGAATIAADGRTACFED